MFEVVEVEVPLIIAPAVPAMELPEEIVVEQRMRPPRTPVALPPETPAPFPESGWGQASQQEASQAASEHAPAPEVETGEISLDEGRQEAAEQLPVSPFATASAHSGMSGMPLPRASPHMRLQEHPCRHVSQHRPELSACRQLPSVAIEQT